ncbi:MAG: hypothetical protein KA144_09585 [Xanthomonadaceae bacterium]|nr:hypothetical protein [Xanthomonadaceae bacterium]
MIHRSSLSATPRPRTRLWLPIAAVLVTAVVVCAALPVALTAAVAQEKSAAAMPSIPSDADEAAIEGQRSAIRQEIAGLRAHRWAGDYYEGDGLGANIAFTLAPQQGFAATWRGCLGLYGANRGRVVEENGMLRLRYDRPNVSGFGGFPEALRPVAWGERRYLIPEARMMAFVNAIHHGYEPRKQIHGMFLLASEDEKRPVVGLPDLPLRYRAMIRREPLELRVVSAALDKKTKESNPALGCNYRYRLTLDRGARDGLAPDLELKTSAPQNVSETARILTVGERTATATLTVLFNDCGRPKIAPNANWRLTTGAYAPTKG